MSARVNPLRARKAVLFDLDGTLIDYGRDIDDVWPRVFASTGATGFSRPQIDAAFNAVFKPIWRDEIRQRAERVNMRRAWIHIMGEAFRTLGVKVESEQLPALAEEFAAGYIGSTQCCPGAQEMLSLLRARGLKVGLITNGDSYVQRGKLANCGLAEMFDVVQIESECGVGKPDPQAYRLVLESLGCRAHHAVMVGDNWEYDVLSPMRLGIDAVWISPNGGMRADANPRPLATIRSLAELLEAISVA